MCLNVDWVACTIRGRRRSLSLHVSFDSGCSCCRRTPSVFYCPAGVSAPLLSTPLCWSNRPFLCTSLCLGISILSFFRLSVFPALSSCCGPAPGGGGGHAARLWRCPCLYVNVNVNVNECVWLCRPCLLYYPLRTAPS